MQTDHQPNSDIPEGLTIRPEAVQTYAKTTGRGKRLVTLYYRREVKSLAKSADFAEQVMADLTTAGAVMRAGVTIILTAETLTTYRCRLEIPIEGK